MEANSTTPSAKKRRMDRDLENDANLDLIEKIEMLDDLLNKFLPVDQTLESLGALGEKLTTLETTVSETKARVKVAAQRLQLDKDNVCCIFYKLFLLFARFKIQECQTNGINTLFLASKMIIAHNEKLRKPIPDDLPTTYDTTEIVVGDVTSDDILYEQLRIKIKRYAYKMGRDAYVSKLHPPIGIFIGRTS